RTYGRGRRRRRRRSGRGVCSSFRRIAERDAGRAVAWAMDDVQIDVVQPSQIVPKLLGALALLQTAISTLQQRVLPFRNGTESAARLRGVAHGLQPIETDVAFHAVKQCAKIIR